MSLQTRALIYQFFCFGVFFIGIQFLLMEFSGLTGFWVPLTSFIVGTLLCPMFKAVKTADGERIFVKWIFLKGVKKL